MGRPYHRLPCHQYDVEEVIPSRLVIEGFRGLVDDLVDDLLGNGIYVTSGRGIHGIGGFL